MASTTSTPSQSSAESKASSSSLTYFPPTKRILTPEQLAAFQESSTHHEIVDFIDALNDSVQGLKLGDGRDHLSKVSGKAIAPYRDWVAPPLGRDPARRER